MEAAIEFILDRYNYWIVIVLMMTGLYIVFARGNLVKKVVGLNLFQTSVFIFYITIGKIAGGTAPIYRGGEVGHGGDHGDSDHGGDDHESSEHGGAGDHGAVDADAESLHSKIDNTALDHGNDLKEALRNSDRNADPATAQSGDSLHVLPEADAGKIANDVLASDLKTPPANGFDIEGADGAHEGAAEAVNGAIDGALHGAGDIVIYTNPLPHVLILTAIVVGVATTAVGLALAVRIREAYGTIEEDELEAADDIAEFGHVPGAPSQASAPPPASSGAPA